jgi:transposase InsO family protein
MFAKKQKAPANPKSSIIPTWPLQRWGVDIVWPLPATPGNLCFAAVALEYFTKWIEAKALAKITSSNLISFVWQRIICRFGVPAYITVDNGKQFNCTKFRKFCSEMGIKLAFALVNHPESNGAVERANGLIHSDIKSTIRFNKRKMGTGTSYFGLGAQRLENKNNRIHAFSSAVWRGGNHAV